MTSVSDTVEKPELVGLIERYIGTQVRSDSEKKIVRKLFLGETSKSFIYFWQDFGGDCAKAVEESVKACTSGKQATINRYKALIKWLNRNTTHPIRVDWPPIDTDNRFERLVYIMRVLQENPRDVTQFLASKLWVSTRVIEDELSSIQHADATCENSFLDTSFVINGITRARGTVRFLSTVHPILLMENLTCLVVMIQSLLEKASNPACREWAMITAGHVWLQLTDYAKGRVEKVMREAYPKNDPVLARFETLKTMPLEGTFITEEDVRREATSQIFYSFKAGGRCRVTHRAHNGRMEIHTGIPVPGSLSKTSVRLRLDDGNEITLSLDSVVSSDTEAGLR